MRDQCLDAYQAVVGCADPLLASGACDAALETCGVTLGAP